MSRLASAVRNYGRYGKFGSKPARPQRQRVGTVKPTVKPPPRPGAWGSPQRVDNQGMPGVREGGSFIPQSTLDAFRNVSEKARAIRTTPPPDPAYETAENRIGTDYGNLVGQYGFGTQQLSQAYGFDADGREITDPQNVLFNPFNRMALLRESLGKANRSASGSMASRGQLYSGALQSRLDLNRQGFDQSEDALRRDYQGGRRALLDAWLAGTSALGGELEEAEENRLTRQLATPPPETAIVGPGPTQLPRAKRKPKPYRFVPKGLSAWEAKHGRRGRR